MDIHIVRGEHHFQRQKEMLERELSILEEYKKANDFLRKNDWLFVSPLFFQGFHLSHLAKLSTEPGNQKAAINKIIFNKFYDIGWTASFIEGYCNRCDHIIPFLPSIETSLILTFQRDYEGSIKTLIPIIEGILRKYLTIEHGMAMPEIRFEHLKKAFTYLKDDLRNNLKKGFTCTTDENRNPIYFSQDQQEELLRLNSAYDEIWFSFVIEFIGNSFYLNTSKSIITNELNRHAILHEYGLNFNYNLENYIKIYFVLYFLTWVFLRKEGKSLMCEIEGYRLFEKSEAYKRIIVTGEKLIYEKHLLLKKYPGFDTDNMKEKFNITYMPIPANLLRKHSILRRLDRFFWKKGYKIS